MQVINKIILFSIIALLIGAAGGYFIGTANSQQSEHNHFATDHSHGSHAAHAHDQREFSGEDVPSISIEVLEDTKSGYNLYISTTNFEFAPDAVNSDAVPGEGHAHLYVNSNKITRLYADVFHIPELNPGGNQITVTLNDNDHHDITVNGEVVADTVTLFVEE